MLTPTPRVQVPGAVAKGEVFKVRALISHAMETGLRRDAEGRAIPRKIINRFLCRYNDVVVFSVDLHEAVAANPYIEFHLRVTESGRLEFVWEEDGGNVIAVTHDISVS
jgi:sulfur-oxidizing protein SoxZ